MLLGDWRLHLEIAFAADLEKPFALTSLTTVKILLGPERIGLDGTSWHGVVWEDLESGEGVSGSLQRDRSGPGTTPSAVRRGPLESSLHCGVGGTFLLLPESSWTEEKCTDLGWTSPGSLRPSPKLEGPERGNRTEEGSNSWKVQTGLCLVDPIVSKGWYRH